MFELTKANDFMTVNDLAQQLYVSRGTILSDLKLVQKWCEKRKLTFISKRSHGIRIVAQEEVKRRIISDLVKEGVFNSIETPYEVDLTVYRQFFHKADLQDLYHIVIDCEDRYNYHLSDISFEGLIIHIALVIERNQQAASSTFENEDSHYDKDCVEFRMADEIIKHVEQLYNIKLPVQEIEYVATHITGKNMNISTEKDEKWFAMQFIVFRFMKAVLLDLEKDIYNEDQLLQGLLNHFSTALIRIQSNQMIQNPLLDSLKEDYGSIFQAVCNRINYLFYSRQLFISDGEIAYIVLHFAAAIEKNNHIKNSIPRVAIACASGAGTSQILFNNILEKFNFHVLGVTSIHKLHGFLEHTEIDLIISTVELNTHIPYIVTTPFLKHEDIVRIQKKLDALGFMNSYVRKVIVKQTNQPVVREIHKALNDYYIHQSENKLKSTLLNVILNDTSEEHSKAGNPLLDMLKETNIRLNITAHTWEDAITLSGVPLLESGCIEESYVEEAIQNVKSLGPYIVIGKGIAIPHANDMSKVHKTAMSMIRLRDPVDFYNSTLGNVQFVFMLASVDEQEHLYALSEFMELLDDERFYKLIQMAVTPYEIHAGMKELLAKQN